MDLEEAKKRSHDPEVVDEVAREPGIWMDVDRSIHRWNQLFRADEERGKRVPPWNEWEWPRRLAALRIDHETTLRYKVGYVDPVTEAYEFVQKMKEEST